MASFTFAPGTVIGGSFRIVRLLKAGGMGAVYVAEQEGVGAKRALKLMHPHLVSDERARKRFELEARVAARIQSDHVVDVVASGIDAEEHIPYIVMELLEGEDLAARLKQHGVLSVDEARLFFEQLCHALGAAHREGIVHRDLKPENLFLARPRRAGEPFTVKILDFGIARVVADARMTTTQGGIGSPLWMAPEQSTTVDTIGPVTDIWALGLLAFHVLTGKYYWRSANDEKASPIACLGEIARGPLEPASARAKDYGQDGRLPPGFDAWFARCVCRDKAGRFQTVEACQAELSRVLAAPRGRRTGLLVGAAVACGVAVVLGGWALSRKPATPARIVSPMAQIPAGAFTMGSREEPDERPPHKVTLPAFAIDRTEVTVAQYAACVHARGCSEAGKADGCNTGQPGHEQHPINCVTHAQAEAYCRWADKRLPTEEEWERAARGDTDRVYPWGNEEPRGRLCWGRCDTKEGTCAVGAFPTGDTPQGVSDLSGNVSEWVQGPLCPYGTPACADERRAVRGGGFCSAQPGQVRAAQRSGYKPGERRSDVGFRCARDRSPLRRAAGHSCGSGAASTSSARTGAAPSLGQSTGA